MKRIFYLLLIIGISKKIDCESNFTITSTVPGGVIVTVNNNTLTTSQENKTEQMVEQNPQQNTEQGIKNDIEQNALQQQESEKKDTSINDELIIEKSKNFISKLIEQKNYIIPIIITTFYITFFIISYKTKRLLTHKNAWCNWDYQPPTTTNYQTFTRTLLKKIHITYQESYNPLQPNTTFITLFLKEIQYEKNILKRYLLATNINSFLYLYKILPGNDMRAIVQEKLKTLSFLESVFLEWVHKNQEQLLQQGI